MTNIEDMDLGALRALAKQVTNRIDALERVEQARATAVEAVEAYAAAAGVTTDEAWKELAPEGLLDGADPAPDVDVDDWKQPTGAHDAYQTGDVVRWQGAVYRSRIDGNIWSPSAYPMGWEKI